ncbi:VOC family protein [Fuerstiella marisgermanici]|uniref:Fosfomycin resistance protein FosB n=1 Tax=Fuerstiella marisgermanici TaxID=1891926 RepID=A0A1P8WCM4_9PLAN|nr:VOC family protein [Fuerstiella marisgermanici]APZ91801.1 fosfomycin resistance protein FosB [Fuerstiella marisgermanici]
MQNSPPITGVSEVVLSVANLPAMRDFYMRVMGFSLHSELSMEAAVADPDGEPTITFLTICETDTPLGRGGHPQLLALIDYRRHVHAKKRLVGHDVTQSTLNHLAFEIPPESFDHHTKRLDELGIDVSVSEFPTMNARAMFFKDPEGNVLELICHHSMEP